MQNTAFIPTDLVLEDSRENSQINGKKILLVFISHQNQNGDWWVDEYYDKHYARTKLLSLDELRAIQGFENLITDIDDVISLFQNIFNVELAS
jgi:hypothetical protein